MAESRTARLLRLLSLLQRRREWAGAELAERLAVTGRTVRRDVDQLRNLGYPIAGTTGASGGYRLTSGRDLPPLLLDDEEAIAIAVGLRTAASAGVAGAEEASIRALAKLEQLLPARLQRQIATAAEATTAVAISAPHALDPGALGVVAAACRDLEVLAFDYRTRGGGAQRRRVEPRSLVAVTGLWYLVAYDLGRDGWRLFRLDRVSGPVPTRLRFTPRPLPAASPADFVRRGLREATYRYQVTATVRLPAATVRARLPRLMASRLCEVDATTSRIELGSDALGPLVSDLAGLDAELAVEGSPEMLGALRRAGRRLLRATGAAATS
ncbi:MAG: helix-turn-helix transcriptional regulator [Candidatus Dormibacteraceae bacterium]